MKSARVLLIIPCYNEQDSIASLLEEISQCCPDYAVLVIDDGSCDSTFSIARTKAPTVRLVRNLGIGGAVQTGIKYAHRHDFDFCVQIDGDGQHPPGEVSKLLLAYAQEPTAITIGSRYLTNGSFRSTWSRRFGGQTIAYALNQLFGGCRVSDPTSGMRLMDRRAMAFFARHYPYDFPEPISLAWALRAGLNMRDVPVEMRAREHGQSSIVGLKPVAYMFRVLGYIVLARMKRTPLS
jgi:glycosyltransferase involved in cell wall biosynthesis